MKKKILFIALIFIAIASCKKDVNPTITTPVTIVGTWSDASSGGKLVITSNKFTIYGSGINLDENTYTISSTTITLKTTSSLFCTENETCSYKFNLTSTNLSFTLINDACFQRNAYMNVTYTKE